MDYSQIKTADELLDIIYASKGVTSKDLAPLSAVTFNKIYVRPDYALLDEVLDKVDFDRLNPQLTMSLMRFTYAARPLLKNWPAALRRGYDTLQARGTPDLDSLFTGLLQYL